MSAVQTAERPANQTSHAASEEQPRGSSHGGRGVRVISPPLTDVELPLLGDSGVADFDLAVAGAGPAGMAVAARVAAAGFSVDAPPSVPLCYIKVRDCIW